MYQTLGMKEIKRAAFDDLFKIVAGSLFIALCAQIRVPLPFTPVPITGHTLGVLMMSVVLGSSKGFFASLVYLLEIFIGLPVRGGASLVGPLAFISPSAGYLLAMPFQAFIAGRKGIQWLFISLLITLLFGSYWLSFFVGWNNAILMGFLPFIPGEIIKCLLVVYCLKRL